MSDNRRPAREFANAAVERGEPLAWFEELYSHSAGDPSAIPWADLTVNPNLMEWLECQGEGVVEGRSLVVGCGLGDDAELLQSVESEATAFDVSPSCIAWCRQRFPTSNVRYCVADVLQPPAEWRRAFNFVFEAYTLQVLPPELRASAARSIAEFVAPNGTLLVVSRGRDAADDPGKMPWPLVRSEFSVFTECGLRESSFEDYVEAEHPPVRRFRAAYLRE